MPVPYYHVVFTLPAAIGAIAFHNKAAVYDLLFRSAAETLITIAADPKHLGARIGLTAVLHTLYKRIILAVDLAEPSSAPKGLAQALELAKMGGGDLRLVNVQPVVPATFMEYVPADFDAEQSKRAKEALDAILESVDLPAGRKSAAARAGGIYHELLQEATDWNADLIVVGSHRPVMSDYLLGSNAKTIVRHAQCSVLVVRQ